MIGLRHVEEVHIVRILWVIFTNLVAKFAFIYKIIHRDVEDHHTKLQQQ